MRRFTPRPLRILRRQVRRVGSLCGYVPDPGLRVDCAYCQSTLSPLYSVGLKVDQNRYGKHNPPSHVCDYAFECDLCGMIWEVRWYPYRTEIMPSPNRGEDRDNGYETRYMQTLHRLGERAYVLREGNYYTNREVLLLEERFREIRGVTWDKLIEYIQELRQAVGLKAKKHNGQVSPPIFHYDIFGFVRAYNKQQESQPTSEWKG